MEGVLARPLAWTVSEDVDGAADLEGGFGAGLLLVEAGGRRGGIAGSGGTGFLAEDIFDACGAFLVLIRGESYVDERRVCDNGLE